MYTPPRAAAVAAPGLVGRGKPLERDVRDEEREMQTVAHTAHVTKFVTEERPLTRSIDAQDHGSERGKAHLSVT
eukprot:5969817-Prymnesium_polylepis.1